MLDQLQGRAAEQGEVVAVPAPSSQAVAADTHMDGADASCFIAGQRGVADNERDNLRFHGRIEYDDMRNCHRDTHLLAEPDEQPGGFGVHVNPDFAWRGGDSGSPVYRRIGIQNEPFFVPIGIFTHEDGYFAKVYDALAHFNVAICF